MKTATVSEAKNQFSALLEQVKKGETVVILQRTTPIARLEPISGTGTHALSALERNGILRRADRPLPKDFFKSPMPSLKKSSTSVAALLRDREEGR